MFAKPKGFVEDAAPLTENAPVATVVPWNPHSSLEIQEQRERLPVWKSKNQFLYAVENHDTVVFTAETGSGKSTQLPQFLVDAGWASGGKVVCCTQPRAVAAMLLAARVATERGAPVGGEVGFATQTEERWSRDGTKLKFVTDGMLLREVLSDPVLSTYSAIVVDEVHERCLQTDLVIATLRHIKKHRKDLRIVVSSATVDAVELARFFQGAGHLPTPSCVMHVPGRVYPVDCQFSVEPVADYVSQAASLVRQLHEEEPPGDFLVFLPGTDEIESLCEDLKEGQLPTPSFERRGNAPSGSTLHFLERARGPRAAAAAEDTSAQHAMEICPLHATMSRTDQLHALQPLGYSRGRRRKVIVASSIAETSVTLPSVTVVIDSGFTQGHVHDPDTGLSGFLTRPVSQAQATQRAGRAGRARPGKCFRLYTRESFAALERETPSDVMCSSLTEAVVFLLAVGVPQIARFKFLQAPPAVSMIRALDELVSIDAVTSHEPFLNWKGSWLARIPLPATLAATALASLHPHLHCSAEILPLVALLSTGSPIRNRKEARQRLMGAHGKGGRMGKPSSSSSGRRELPEEEEDALQSTRAFYAAEGDHITWINVYRGFVNADCSEAFCLEHGFHFGVLRRAHRLRIMLDHLMEEVIKSDSGRNKLGKGTCATDVSLVLKAVLHGFPTHLARLHADGSYRTLRGDRRVEFSPDAVLSSLHASTGVAPWVCYTSLTVSPGGLMMMGAASAVNPKWSLEVSPQSLRLVEVDPTRALLAAATARDDGEIRDEEVNAALLSILGSDALEETEAGRIIHAGTSREAAVGPSREAVSRGGKRVVGGAESDSAPKRAKLALPRSGALRMQALPSFDED
jgi:ATP-dependent RNA helicase DDX35